MPQKFEYYDDTPDTFDYIYNTSWSAQTFTPTVTHTITSVKLKLYRVGLPGTLTVSIQATTADNPPLPTNVDLATGNMNGNTITTDGNGELYEIAVTSVTVTAGQHYAIVAKAPDAPPDESAYVAWLIKRYYGSYTGGTEALTPDAGTSWSSNAIEDCLFEEWGTLPAALLNPGYWHATYWARGYWNPLYWQKYGAGLIGGDSSRYYYHRKKPKLDEELFSLIKELLTVIT